MNPLAAAKMFQTIVEHVFEKLFGMTLAHKTKSTGLPPGKKPQGALGTVWDAFIIFETQGAADEIAFDNVPSLLPNQLRVHNILNLQKTNILLLRDSLNRSRIPTFPRHHLGRHSVPDVFHHRTRQGSCEDRRSSYRPDRLRPSAERLPRRGRQYGHRSPSCTNGWTSHR